MVAKSVVLIHYFKEEDLGPFLFVFECNCNILIGATVYALTRVGLSVFFFSVLMRISVISIITSQFLTFSFVMSVDVILVCHINTILCLFSAAPSLLLIYGTVRVYCFTSNPYQSTR